jgi:hypothetical protein
VFTAKSGEKFLAKGEGDNLVFYFWLTKKVVIPERAFLRTAYEENSKRIVTQTERAVGAVLSGKMTVDNLLDLYGQQMSGAIKKKIRDINSPPNSSATILAKGSSNPLIDSSSMIEGVTWKKE